MSKNTYTPEIKERAVRMLIEASNVYPSAWPLLRQSPQRQAAALKY